MEAARFEINQDPGLRGEATSQQTDVGWTNMVWTQILQIVS